MSNAAIYARVSSARQKEQETIGSQTAALRRHAEQLGLEVPEQWVFEDDGHSGASLVRPALERLRDLVCQVPVDVLLVYAPDRLARKYAYQALLIEEFGKAGTTVMFVKGPCSDSPEDALLTQFQGMIAEYERAQILERTRRGKTHRAKAGTVNVLSGAPFGYRYVRKSEHAEARYQVVPHEAAIVAELFTRYADGGVSISELTRWLTGLGVASRTGKTYWDRSVVWGMLRNPAYAGLACFGKTMRTQQIAGLNRTARLAGRTTPKHYTVIERPREEWLEIPVPALVAEDTWHRAQRRLADNKRYASRNSTNPSLLQGICVCANCGYAYYRTSTRTTNKIIYYYRCLGSDDYRYQQGRVCANKPVRADYVDAIVWGHISELLSDPALIRNEITRRLEQVRTADPDTVQRSRLSAGLGKASEAINRLIGAYQEQLISLDELRSRMPELRTRETSLRQQIEALDTQLADRQVYLTLADNLEHFLTTLRGRTATATVAERQRVLRLLVKEVHIGPEKITIRHSIPIRNNPTGANQSSSDTDSEGETQPDCQLRWRSHDATLRRALIRWGEAAMIDHPCPQPPLDPLPGRKRAELVEEPVVIDTVERRCQVCVEDPHPLGPRALGGGVDRLDRIVAAAAGPEPVGSRLEPCLPLRLQCINRDRLQSAVSDHRNPEWTLLSVGLGDEHPTHGLGRPRRRPMLHPADQLGLRLGPQRSSAVDARRLMTSVDLRDPPNTQQSVRAGPQHQPLQTTDPLQVPFP
jgi:site-specific DNA recombinase